MGIINAIFFTKESLCQSIYRIQLNVVMIYIILVRKRN